jgi:hypothetical protein
MKIVIINSEVLYKISLIEMPARAVICTGMIDRID